MIQIKVLMSPGGKHRRRKGTKCFTHFDESIDPIAHLRTAGIGQNGTGTERARTELHPALTPSHYFSLLQLLRGIAQHFRSTSSEVLELGGGGFQEAPHT